MPDKQITPELIEEFRRLESGATKGPWSYWEFDCFKDWMAKEGDENFGIEVRGASISGPAYWPDPEATYWTVQDAALIVFLRNHAPAILARLAALERLREAVEKMHPSGLLIDVQEALAKLITPATPTT